jgi:hypothetical protein
LKQKSIGARIARARPRFDLKKEFPQMSSSALATLKQVPTGVYASMSGFEEAVAYGATPGAILQFWKAKDTGGANATPMPETRAAVAGALNVTRVHGSDLGLHTDGTPFTAVMCDVSGPLGHAAVMLLAGARLSQDVPAGVV